MPIGVPQGSLVELTAQFYDANGNVLTPPPIAVTLNVAYTQTNGQPTVSQVAAVQIGYTYAATWNSGGAAFGQAVVSWTVGVTTLSPPDPLLFVNGN